MKIAIIGSHGTRKSTLSYQLAAYYKEIGKNVKLIQEVARSSPFGINENFNFDSMRWIIHTQIIKEMEAAKDHQVVICDRSSIDPIVYGMCSFEVDQEFEHLYQMAADWMGTYAEIIFVAPDLGTITPDGVRDTNLEFQHVIHCQMAAVLADMPEAIRDRIRTIRASQIEKQNQMSRVT